MLTKQMKLIADHKHAKAKSVGLALLLVFSLALVVVWQFSQADLTQASALPANRPRVQPAALAVPEAPAATPPIQCNLNPFGDVHELFQEQEIFVSMTSADAAISSNFALLSYFLDQRPDGALTELGAYLELADSNAYNIQAHAAAVVDLDGDGDSDFIQPFVNGNGNWYVALYDDPNPIPLSGVMPTYYLLSNRNYSHLTASAGDIFGDRDAQDQVVMAGVDPVTGMVNVILWDGTTNAGALQITGRWSSAVGGRQHAKSLDVVVGNFNGNEKDDIAVAIVHNDNTMELVLLEYDPTHNIGVEPNVEQSLKPLTTKEFSYANPSSMHVAAGRLNADFVDEVIVVYDQSDADINNRKVLVNAFSYDTVSASPGLVQLTAFDHTRTYYTVK